MNRVVLSYVCHGQVPRPNPAAGFPGRSQGKDLAVNELHRRRLLKAAGAAGAAASLLAACGGEDPEDDARDDARNQGEQDREESQGSETDAPEDESGSEGEGETGVRLSADEIPVGGGTILRDQRIVVTQPSRGEFKAFSAICTHNRCTVSTVSDGTITCECHFSKFTIEDGSVVSGPAPRPLDEIGVTVEGGDVLVEG